MHGRSFNGHHARDEDDVGFGRRLAGAQRGGALNLLGDQQVDGLQRQEIGMRVAEELLKRDPSHAIVLYGDEPWEPYQRVQLSALLTPMRSANNRNPSGV